MLKDEYPKLIADMLGIPPVQGSAGPWMSNEGTVLRDWLEAVGEALDIPYAGEKTRMMKALVEAVGEQWDPAAMTSRQTTSGGGGNIRIEAFQALQRGLMTQAEAERRRELNQGRGPFEPPGPPGASEDSVVLRAIRQRAGQPSFRAALLSAYAGRCAVTGCDAPAALEAAHVLPYGLGGTYEVTNGLLLRADIHTLFDMGLLAFDASRCVTLQKELVGTTPYAALLGSPLADPKPSSHRVPDQALAEHRSRAGF